MPNTNNVRNILSKYIEYLDEHELQYPINGLDYSSLYPSLIMAYNLSPEYLILDSEYKEEVQTTGKQIHNINFEYKYENYLQEKHIKYIEGWTVRHDENKEITDFGLYPTILKDLFAQRAEMKKDLFIYKQKKEHIESSQSDYLDTPEYKECLFKLNYCDTKQKALKVFMNTFYGELGNKNSPLFILELAGAVTSAGQANLLLVKDYVENLGHKVYYGDSVVGDTPILVRINKKELKLVSIEEYLKEYQYEKYNNEKEIINIESLNIESQEIYTENGWTPIKKIIRHFTSKKLYKINTHTGSIIVTEDHSLLNKEGKKITPNETKVGTELLHWDNLYSTNIDTNIKFHDIHKKVNNLSNNYSLDELKNTIVFNIAFVYGFFFGDGSCGNYNCDSGPKSSFALNNSNLKYLDVCVKIFNSYYNEVQLEIYDTLDSSHVYKATAKGKVKNLVTEWRNMFYSDRKHKKVPDIILNSDNIIKIAFMQGYYLADGDTNCNRMDNKGQIGSQGLYLLMNSLGYNVSINTRKDKLEMYRLTFTTNKFRKSPTVIKKIEYIGETEQYVYDLETETHHFAAGIGKLVVHNTDSLYISCPESYYLEENKEYYTEQIDKIQYNTDLVTITFKAIEDIKIKVNKYLYQDNGTKYLKMAYEEILWPCAFLSKKKYYGIPHEHIPNFKPAEMFIRGLEVKKRGVSELTKIVCLDVMWKSLDLNNTKTLRELLIHKIKEIFITKWELKDFIQTGLWKPEKKNVTLNEFAQRMKDTNKQVPEPGERFNYVIVKKYPYKYDFKGRQVPLKKADKMEYLEAVVDNNYDIDLKYYFDKQLTGQFARLLSYDSEFTEYSIDADTEQLEYDDTRTLNKCKKYILNMVEAHGNNYVDRNKIFKGIYKEVYKKYKTEKYTNAKIENEELYNKKYNILFTNLVPSVDSLDESVNLHKFINENIEKYINKAYNLTIMSNNIIKKNKKNMSALTTIYNGKKTSHYNLQQNNLTNSYNNKFDLFIKGIIKNKLDNVIFNIDNINVINIIQHIRQKHNIDKICGSQEEINSIYDIVDETELNMSIADIELYTKIDPNLVKKLYNDYIELISIKKLILLHEHIYNNIYAEKNSKNGNIEKPFGFKF